MIAGVGVDDTTAAGRRPCETTLKGARDERGSCDTLRFNQLLTAAKLTGGDVVLNRGDDHWDSHHGLEMQVASATIPSFKT